MTGAAGFAGSHLLDRLATRHTPISAWRRPGGRPPRPQPGVEWTEVDLLDRTAVRQALQRVAPAAVYHCAGAAHVGRAWDRTAATLAINVRGTQFLLEAVAAAGRPIPVLVVSSAMVYRPADHPISEEAELLPENPYGVTKLAAELLAARMRAEGVDVRIVRPFNHIGPRQQASFVAADFARQIVRIERGLRAPELVVGNLAARRDLTDVRDTVRAYELVVEGGRPGRPYNVASGEARTVRELLDGLIARARRPVTVRVDPQRFQPNDRPLLVGDATRIRTELGWRPGISFDQTLDDLLEYWRAEME